MTSTVKQLAAALLAAAALASVAASGSAVAAPHVVRALPNLGSLPPLKNVGGGAPVIRIPVQPPHKIEDPRHLRFGHLNFDHGYGPGYRDGCYYVLKFSRLVKICPAYDYDDN